MNTYTPQIAIAYLFLQMCFIWLLYKRYNNPSIVDVSWSLGLMVSGLIYLSSAKMSLRLLVIASLLIIWALRLALHLYLTRIAKGEQDKRYAKLSAEWKINHSLGFFLNFQLQALLIFIISFIFFFIGNHAQSNLSYFDMIAIMLVIIGIGGESLADAQLFYFKRSHVGQVCNIGLWRYSRHPNYFFDFMTWAGFTVFALQANYGCFSLISLGMLYVIFTRITGPMTENGSLQSRGAAYAQYQRETSMFIPWVSKKNSHSTLR